ncbi:hypothetical protein ROZALSC1DRAFT_30022, partial [Rozella allomycis CSF55]
MEKKYVIVFISTLLLVLSLAFTLSFGGSPEQKHLEKKSSSRKNGQNQNKSNSYPANRSNKNEGISGKDEQKINNVPNVPHEKDEDDYFTRFNIRKLPSGVLVGEANLPTGTVYLGFEKIDDDKGSWYDYATFAQNFIHFSGISSNKATKYMEIQASRRTEWHEKFNGKTREILDGAGGGVAGFVFSIGDYVAYISSEPITGKYNFGEMNSPIPVSYIDSLKPLIMVVRSTNVCKDHLDTLGFSYYENRGIFRNPINLLENPARHKGLSMLLHSFTMAAQKALNAENAETLWMNVAPFMSMQDILEKTLLKNAKPDEYFVKDDTKENEEKISHANLPDALFQGSRFPLGILDVPYLIKESVLLRLYESI